MYVTHIMLGLGNLIFVRRILMGKSRTFSGKLNSEKGDFSLTRTRCNISVLAGVRKLVVDMKGAYCLHGSI